MLKVQIVDVTDADRASVQYFDGTTSRCGPRPAGFRAGMLRVGSLFALMPSVFAECRRMLPVQLAARSPAVLDFDYLKISRGRPLAVLGATRPGVLFAGHEYAGWRVHVRLLG